MSAWTPTVLPPSRTFAGQGVRGDERVRPGVQRPAAELLDQDVQAPGHLGYLRLGKRRDPTRGNELLEPAGRHPEDVGGSHDRDQRRLRPAATVQQPLREVGPAAQPRDRQVDRARSRVPRPLPVAVARVHPVRRALPVLRTALRVRLRAHQRPGERLQHRAQRVRTRLLQLPVHPGRQVILALAVIALLPCEIPSTELPKDHAMTAPDQGATLNTTQNSYTTTADTTLNSG